MANPTKRLPAVAPPPASQGEPALAPAPDNGQPYAERTPSNQDEERGRREHPKHLGRQVGLRVPVKLWDRLEACAQDTGIAKTSLLVHALDAELSRRGF